MATALPTAASFTGSTVTEAQFKTAITDLRTFLADLLGTDGVTSTALGTLGCLLTRYAAKTGAYTVLSSDRGTAFNCGGSSFTITTPAAATVGAGFAFAVRNYGGGTITIDGNGAETIDGAASIALAAGESALIVSTGSAWITYGKSTTITDYSITTIKLQSRFLHQVLHSNTSQTLTTSYATYIARTQYLSSVDNCGIFALASVKNTVSISRIVYYRITRNGTSIAAGSSTLPPAYDLAPAGSSPGVQTIMLSHKHGPIATGTYTYDLDLYANASGVSVEAGLVHTIREPA